MVNPFSIRTMQGIGHAVLKHGINGEEPKVLGTYDYHDWESAKAHFDKEMEKALIKDKK